MPDGALEYAAALRAVAGHLRGHGAAGLDSAVKRLDDLAHELVSDAEWAEGCLPEAAADLDRTWLAGLAWLNSLTPEERAKVFATFGAPLAAAPAHAEALADIARDIRGWGSVALFGEADRLDGIARALKTGGAA